MRASHIHEDVGGGLAAGLEEERNPLKKLLAPNQRSGADEEDEEDEAE